MPDQSKKSLLSYDVSAYGRGRLRIIERPLIEIHAVNGWILTGLKKIDQIFFWDPKREIRLHPHGGHGEKADFQGMVKTGDDLPILPCSPAFSGDSRKGSIEGSGK